MRLPRGAHWRTITKPSGKQVRQIVDGYGRVVETIPVIHKVRRTKTGRRLAARHRRIMR